MHFVLWKTTDDAHFFKHISNAIETWIGLNEMLGPVMWERARYESWGRLPSQPEVPHPSSEERSAPRDNNESKAAGKINKLLEPLRARVYLWLFIFPPLSLNTLWLHSLLLYYHTLAAKVEKDQKCSENKVKNKVWWCGMICTVNTYIAGSFYVTCG